MVGGVRFSVGCMDELDTLTSVELSEISLRTSPVLQSGQDLELHGTPETWAMEYPHVGQTQTPNDKL